MEDVNDGYRRQRALEVVGVIAKWGPRGPVGPRVAYHAAPLLHLRIGPQ